jgi:hypothetical protein
MIGGVSSCMGTHIFRFTSFWSLSFNDEESPLIRSKILKSVWNFTIKYEFWFSILVIVGLYVGEYRTGEMWMGNLALLLFLLATTRLAMHPMWKKDEE